VPLGSLGRGGGEHDSGEVHNERSLAAKRVLTNRKPLPLDEVTGTMRVALITNPRAGRNSGLMTAALAEEELRGGGWEVTRWLTEGPGDAERLARQAADEGFDLVLACGGDGTLSQALVGLLDTSIPVGIVPAGTGNDFARTIRLNRNPTDAARQLLSGHATDIDLLDINEGGLWSVNVLGLGFDAAVAERMNRRRRLAGGLLANLIAVGQELITYRPREVRLRVGGEEWGGRALLLAVANARSYGAGMKIAPTAEIDDGLLDVILVEHMGRIEFLRSFPMVLRGTHLSHPSVHAWQAEEVAIETPEPLPVLVDGDVQCETPLHIRVSRRRARFWMPGPQAP